MAFYDISKPIAYPVSAPPGPVLITVPITSLVDYYTEVTVRIRIFEGSIFPGSGRELARYSQDVGLYPSVETDVQYMHSSELTDSQSRRDIEVSIWQGSNKFEEDSWDDIFYVTKPEEPPPEEPDQVLEIDITGGVGHVVTSPSSIEGKSIWNDNDTGTFAYGTEVRVTAHPDSGYEFEKWSDEIEGGVNTNNPAFVKPMTEHRAVKCHFRVIEEEPVWPLEVDITPSAGGVVRTSPASIEGRTVWYRGSIGTFKEGTIVQVTAVPNNDYQFVKWTDEIQGGTSYNNPSSVKPMTEHRAIKCHFRLIEEPPPEPECSIDSDCPSGYVCQNGVCVPEEEPPPTCSVDSDCPPGYVCRDGKCVKEGEKIAWLPVALIGGGVVIGLIVLSKPRKKKGAGRSP